MYSSATSIGLWVKMKCFKPHNGYFHVVAFTFKETFRLLESPFHVELNGSYPNFIY